MGKFLTHEAILAYLFIIRKDQGFVPRKLQKLLVDLDAFGFLKRLLYFKHGTRRLNGKESEISPIWKYDPDHNEKETATYCPSIEFRRYEESK